MFDFLYFPAACCMTKKRVGRRAGYRVLTQLYRVFSGLLNLNIYICCEGVMGC